MGIVSARHRRGLGSGWLLAFVIGSATSTQVSAQDLGVGDLGALTQHHVEALHDAAGMPAVSVAIAVHGDVVWSTTVGTADLESNAPATIDTRFRLASVSKLLTAAALARSIHAGSIELEADIRDYVPQFPHAGVTIRQLAGHTGGIRSYGEQDYSEDRNIDFLHFESIGQSLGLFLNDPLEAPPGEAYHYSVFGYTLLSAAIGAANGQDFLSYLGSAVLAPLAMRGTGPDRRTEIVPHRAGFYERGSDGVIRNSSYVDPSYKWAGGGLLSTAEDLARFGSSHLREGFLTSEIRAEMFRSQRLTDGTETGVGLGWRVAEDEERRTLVHHAGNMGGARSILVMYPDLGLVVAALSNLSLTPLYVEATAQALAAPFLAHSQAQAISVASLASLTGTWELEISGLGPESISSTLTVGATPDGTLGFLENPAPLVARSASFGIPRPKRLPIVGALDVEGSTRLYVAAPYGLLELEFDAEGDSIDGRIRGLFVASEISGRRAIGR